jgi:hypothetical protein
MPLRGSAVDNSVWRTCGAQVTFAEFSGSEVEWWFADLTDQEAEQLYVTAREEVAILRQVREEV